MRARAPGTATDTLSTFLTGDPARLSPEVAALGDLVDALGLPGMAAPGLLPLAPDVVLVHSLTGRTGHIALRWARLPHGPALITGAKPASVAVVLTAPITEGARALRLVARLKACLRDAAVLREAGTAGTREDLARALAAADAAGEIPLSGSEVLALLGSSPGGLPTAEVARRRQTCGENRLERLRRRPLALRFVEQFWSFFAVLLWVGGVLAFLARLPELGWAVFAVILVNGVGSFLQEYRAERAVEALQDLLPHEITAVRDGRDVRIPATALVPGDVVRLAEGDQIPADGHLLEAAGLRVDQSLLTGESQPALKLPVSATDSRPLRGMPPSDRHDLLFAGTAVAAGAATVVVSGTGMATEIGRIAQLTQTVVEDGIDPGALRQAHDLRVVYPFDSFRKRMTLVQIAQGQAVAHVKGALQETLALCETIRWEDRTVALTDERRQAVLTDHNRLATDGLRLLAVAVRTLPDDGVGAPVTAVERELTFLGFVALWDPPRPEVADAIATCRRAGIRVLMITGDYGLTAQAIARQIALPVTKVVTGEELDRLPPAGFRALVAEEDVLFARTSPGHKLAIVSALRAQGEVVAVTGDGVNDAPALKAADIGVAMGRRGSAVAKEAAVMVITDDNFASIVAAVRQGRAVYANMGKFVTYIFASNVPELVPFLAFVFLRIPLPLTVMQILAVDLGTDLVPALALGAEPPEPGIMDRPPRRRDERLLGSRRLLHAYGFLGPAEAVLALGAFFWSYWLAGWRPGLPMAASGELYRRATTMTLAGIVACQVGNVFTCRTDRESVFQVGILRNRLVLLGIGAEVGILLALILVPPLRTVFGLAPLALREWSVLLLFPPLMLLADETRKGLLRSVTRRRPAPAMRTKPGSGA